MHNRWKLVTLRIGKDTFSKVLKRGGYSRSHPLKEMQFLYLIEINTNYLATTQILVSVKLRP